MWWSEVVVEVGSWLEVTSDQLLVEGGQQGVVVRGGFHPQVIGASDQSSTKLTGIYVLDIFANIFCASFQVSCLSE
ncbi:hypothetical protein CsSME_00036693 [Camellia sinensis var. sinensis]